MDIIIPSIISLVLGFAVGLAVARRRGITAKLKNTREFTQALESSTRTGALFYALALGFLRCDLSLVAAGDLEKVKSVLSQQIAILYQSRRAVRSQFEAEPPLSPEPEELRAEMRAVEEDSERYPDLRAALQREQAGTVDKS